jgi:two-component system, OmpR family, phosphate regulon sensor histidine kinase PhoR
MKNSAFLLRVGICFLLSMIPLPELENRIYSERLSMRGVSNNSESIIIVEVGWDDQSPAAIKAFQSKLLKRGAKAVAPIPTPTGELIIDSDSVFRRAVSETRAGGPSLALRLLRQFDPESVRPKTATDAGHLVNFAGPAGTIKRCRVSEALESDATACGPIRGKIVLIDGSPDYLPPVRTPLGNMSYSEALANDVHTVVKLRPLYQAGMIEVGLIILAMILVGSFYIIYYPVLISAIAVTLTGVAIVILLFQGVFVLFDIYIPSANIASSALITYLVFTGYRLDFLEHLQWRSLKQAQYLRELDQMKTNFLSLASHDLKTPLAKIQAVVERLRRELMNAHPGGRADWIELLDSIENSNGELRHYIGSILNLSKIESQKVILNKKSNDINLLIQQALKRLKSLANQKAITIDEQLEPLFSIECDEDLMRQVLTNLIDNAIKYSPNGAKVIVRSREEEGSRGFWSRDPQRPTPLDVPKIQPIFEAHERASQRDRPRPLPL